MGTNTADDLRIGIEIARDDFDLVEKLTESELAQALRLESEHIDYPHLLLAIADALDNPEAEYQLRLVRNRRGAPSRKGDVLKNIHIAKFVRGRLNQGIKQEAVVAEIREHLGISRATAMKSLAEGRKLLPFTDELHELAQKVIEKRKGDGSPADL